MLDQQWGWLQSAVSWETEADISSLHLLSSFFLVVSVASIIFSNGRDLLIGDLHGRNFQILVESKNRGQAMGVDFHYQKRRVFWTDPVQDKVGRKYQGCSLWAKGNLKHKVLIAFHFGGSIGESSFVFWQKRPLRYFMLISTFCMLYYYMWPGRQRQPLFGLDLSNF